jgi:hypothetical protein
VTLAVQKHVMATAPADLSRPARSVLSALAFMAGRDGLRWPVGDSRLMRDTGYSLSSVRRGRRQLVARGLLQVEEVGAGRSRSVYRLLQLEAVAAPLAAAVGAENEHAAGSGRTPPVVNLTTPTRARTLFFEGSPALTQHQGQGPNGDTEVEPLRGAEPHIGPADAGRRPPCPRAVSRGAPCASCRACGTNPRALRAAQRRPAVSDELARARVMNPLVNPEQLQRNARGAAAARAILNAQRARAAARARAKPSAKKRGSPPEAPDGPSPGAP